MTTKEKIAVMQAYVDGKTVQCMYKGNWVDFVEPPIWNWRDNQYRIKPEEKLKLEEKYRQYKDYHEMTEDFCERFGVNCPKYAMPFIWIKNKEEDYVFMIHTFQGYDADDRLESYFKNYTYLDGSPVGKKVEE